MIFKLDPPPATNNIATLRDYVNELYENVAMVIHNLDSDNMTEDFLIRIQQKNESEVS